MLSKLYGQIFTKPNKTLQSPAPTLSADQDDGYLLDVPVLAHLGVVVVDRVEGSLVLQTAM